MSTFGLVVGISNLVCAGIGIALSIPLLRRRIKRNRLYGVRFARSFESDELWYAINEYGARRMICWSIVLALIGVVSVFVADEGRPWLAVLLAFAPVVFVIPAIESYRYAQRL